MSKMSEGQIIRAAMKLGQSKGATWKKDKPACGCKGSRGLSCTVVYKGRGKKKAVLKTTKNIYWRLPSRLKSPTDLAGVKSIKLPVEFSSGTPSASVKKASAGKSARKAARKVARKPARKPARKASRKQAKASSARGCSGTLDALTSLERAHGMRLDSMIRKVKTIISRSRKSGGSRPGFSRRKAAQAFHVDTSGGMPSERSTHEEL